MTKFTLEIEQGSHGLWYVTSPDLTGLMAVGRTLDEALRDVAEDGREMLAAMRDDGAKTPQREAFEAVFA